MTWDEAAQALLDHFEAQWAALHPTVPIEFPNAKPLSIDSETAGYLRITFPHSSSRIIVLGGGRTREQRGRVVVESFRPLGEGAGTSIAWNEDIATIWDDAKANGLSGDIFLQAPEPLVPGRDPDIPAWHYGQSTPVTVYHQP